MAIIEYPSLLFRGISGQFGKQVVFRQHLGVTVVSKFPAKTRRKPTVLQQVQHERFKLAIAYARSILNDPFKKAEYQKKLKRHQSVFNTAVAEYLKSLK